ncbi:MAG: ATP-binding protein [Bacillota bacterium]
MKSPAPIDATLSSRAEPMARLEAVIDRAAEEYGLPYDLVTNLRIAMDEVVSNILKYAYSDDAGHDIAIRCEIRDGRLETTVEDDGCAFDPLEAPAPQLDVPLDQRKVGGLGIHMVKELMDGVSYERIGGRNRLTLKQDLPGGAQ